MIQQWWFWVILAYLSGSVSYALLIGLAKGVDIRKQGSGNVGATNAGRVLGKKWGGLCFMLDVFKGAAPVFLAGLAMGWSTNWARPAGIWQWQWLAVAGAAVVGHVFPIWLKFKGGKGVATGLGVLLGIWPILTIAGICTLFTWLIVVAIWRYVGLASVVAAISLPIYVVIATLCVHIKLQDRAAFLVVTILLATLVVVRHRSNIKRLLAGEEPKIKTAK